MIAICQDTYYSVKMREIAKKISLLEHALRDFALESKMSEYTAMSMRLLKAELHTRYS